MPSNELGDHFRILTFGESHGPAVGVVIDGVRPGLALSPRDIQVELDRRRPGTSDLVSPRAEPDQAEIVSGVFEGRTTGAPICILVRNRDARSADYEALAELVRPGHGVGWLARYGVRDWRGGGRTSGRETVGRVAAGAVARRLLADRGVQVRGRVVEIAGIQAGPADWGWIDADPVRCGDADASVRMAAAIRAARDDGDSVGGIVEVTATGVPAGLGDPVFWKLEAELARALMSIGAVRGFEVGDGFQAARVTGLAHNDRPTAEGFQTNHAGGVLGGISTGQPLVVRLAVKPTPTVGRSQPTVDLAGRPGATPGGGRHDPCICPRLVPVAEAMVACVLADAWMRRDAGDSGADTADLPTLRLAIEREDDALLAALGRRMALSVRVGELKRKLGLAVQDPVREDAVRRAWMERAALYGVPGDLASDVLDRVLVASRDVQSSGDLEDPGPTR